MVGEEIVVEGADVAEAKLGGSHLPATGAAGAGAQKKASWAASSASNHFPCRLVSQAEPSVCPGSHAAS
jgi:hypothetical protein